jgi:23S rRNA-/tRNA-specific pseudouridylate synthase
MPARHPPSLFSSSLMATMTMMRRNSGLIAAAVATCLCCTLADGFTRSSIPTRTLRPKFPFQLSSEPSIEEATQPESSAVPVMTRYKRAVKGVTSKNGPLNEEVARLADISLGQANELIQIGAVWARMDTLSQEDLLTQYDGSSPASANILYSDYNPNQQDESVEEYVERMESQRYRRILTPSTVQAGTDIRVYPTPRRFPSCYDITQDSLLYEDTTFLVVDKPPMLPTQPDASNYHECCPGCVNDLLGPFFTITGEVVARPLLCHRVDSCVGGCVVLSKDPNGQKVFSELQRDRKLRKIYKAVTTSPVPLGMHIHWMWSPQSARGQTGGPPCQLLSHTPPESRRKARVRTCRVQLHVMSNDATHSLTNCSIAFLIFCSNFGHDVPWR